MQPWAGMWAAVRSALPLQPSWSWLLCHVCAHGTAASRYDHALCRAANAGGRRDLLATTQCLVAEATGDNGLVSATSESWGSVHVQALSQTTLAVTVSLAEGRRFQVVSATAALPLVRPAWRTAGDCSFLPRIWLPPAADATAVCRAGIPHVRAGGLPTYLCGLLSWG